MAYYMIQTRYGNPQAAIKGWYDEPNGSFGSIEEAQAAMQSLADVCGYDADHMRIVEIAD